MSKGIVNNRDKFVWDNAHKPDISDVVGEIDDKMDDLLDDHDDKVVDIVGDNMNDLLDAHDDKVVSIVGDNMGTLLTSAASTVQLIAGDKSGITTTAAVKVGKWDATHDLYAKRYTGTLQTTTGGANQILDASIITPVIASSGYVFANNTVNYPLNSMLGGSYSNLCVVYSDTTTGLRLGYGVNLSEGIYDIVVYYLVATT